MSASENVPVLTAELVKRIGESEKRLWQVHGVRIRVDRIAHDGRILICTALQVRKAPLVKAMDTITLVQHTEVALHPLLAAGFTPMITAIDRSHGEELRKSMAPIDEHDPIGAITAFREAGLPYPRSVKGADDVAPILNDSLWRRAIGLFAV